MDLTMIVPAYNEEANVFPFFEEALRVFKDTGMSYEIIFVDDGSKDGTFKQLQSLVEHARTLELPAGQQAPTVNVISFSRNFGKESALYAGLEHAQGDLMCFIDADLQQEPSTLLEMVHIIQNDPNIDCVAACQENRSSGIVSFFSKRFYKVLAKSSNMDVIDNASDFRLFRRCVAEALLSMGEYQRFSKGLFSWIGFNTYAFPYTPSQRHAGQSTWSLTGLFRYAVNGLMSFSVMPLKWIVSVGTITSLVAFLYLIVVLIQRLAFGVDVPGYATIVALILLLGGIQLLGIGAIGEYLSRMYIEGKNRPIYITRRFFSSEQPDEAAEGSSCDTAE